MIYNICTTHIEILRLGYVNTKVSDYDWHQYIRVVHHEGALARPPPPPRILTYVGADVTGNAEEEG